MLTSKQHVQAARRDGPAAGSATTERVRQLRDALAHYRRQRRGVQKVRPTGLAPLDAALPGGGLPAGAVTEILTAHGGVGALTLALRIANEENFRFPISDFRLTEKPQHKSEIILVDTHGDFYPPAALALGIDLQRLWVIRPRCEAEAFWAVDQSLRCPAVGSVVALFEQLDDRASRRLQLAAEAGGGVGLLLRPAASREPSFAVVRMIVEPFQSSEYRVQSTEFRVRGAELGDQRSDLISELCSLNSELCNLKSLHLIKVREGTPVGPIVVDLNHETGDVPVFSESFDRPAVAAG